MLITMTYVERILYNILGGISGSVDKVINTKRV